MAHFWQGKEMPYCQVLIAIFEQVGNSEFQDFLRAHIKQKTLARIIMDECHYAVFSRHDDFRPGMVALSTLVSLGVPLVLLTATALITCTTKLLDFYGVPGARVIQASTNCPNIEYVVKEIRRPDLDQDDTKYVYQEIKKAIEKYMLMGGKKLIVYLQVKELLNKIFALSHSDPETTEPWMRYHASMQPKKKKAALEAWVQVILSTSALGLGLNARDCALILLYQPPRTMVEYVQESGWASWDGSSARAVLLWNCKPQSKDRVMDYFLTTSLCRCRVLFGYMDGEASDCLSLPGDNLLCDNCATAITNTAEVHRASLPEPNTIIAP
ncbi:hypothetical protein FRC01_013733 [Tulasnella sp. 417]|nr:hypothetical protein FRC01_013733 [Tulasnella sp. 417]